MVTFSKDATFYSIYLFRRTPFLQDTFSEELIFHTDLFAILSLRVLSCVFIIAQSRIIDA